MKIKNALLTVALVGATALITANVVSQNDDDHGFEIPADVLAKMTPGEHHQKLNPFVGTWTYESKMWMDPASDPHVSKGTSTFEWVLDGRYLMGTFHGDMGGMPFEGLQYLGHDNNRNEYVSVWMDNMGTAMYMSKGTMKGNALETSGKMDDCMTGRKDVPMREVTTIVDSNTIRFEMFVTDENGKEAKVMEITHKKGH